MECRAWKRKEREKWQEADMQRFWLDFGFWRLSVTRLWACKCISPYIFTSPLPIVCLVSVWILQACCNRFGGWRATCIKMTVPQRCEDACLSLRNHCNCHVFCARRENCEPELPSCYVHSAKFVRCNLCCWKLEMDSVDAGRNGFRGQCNAE